MRIWFEDNGIGINPLHHERIFQIFGEVHSEAAQRMNGEMGVESEANQGSRFWLLLNEEL